MGIIYIIYSCVGSVHGPRHMQNVFVFYQWFIMLKIWTRLASNGTLMQRHTLRDTT